MDFYINVASKSLTKENEELCGDKVEIIRNDDSVIIIMADGMGSGVKANILATLTCKIIGTMLKEGANIEDTVETVVKTLPECNIRKVAYCTFTILQIFYTGKAYLIEYDNPNMVVFRNKHKWSPEGSVKTINDKKIKETRFNVDIGDLFGIVSDGIVHAGEGNTLNMGWQLENVSEFIEYFVKNGDGPDKICKMLSDTCDGLYGGKYKDDATTVIVAIEAPKLAKIMIGPPINHDLDKEAVNELLSGSGIKIVCGGTTSRIVGRYVNAGEEGELFGLGSDVPPISQMKGIDLVTEGVLTLSKVSDILNLCLKDKEFIKSLDIKDGADKLASIIMNNCTDINFIVGTAENPVHKNVDTRISFEYKMKLIDSIANKLKMLDKRIRIQYF